MATPAKVDSNLAGKLATTSDKPSGQPTIAQLIQAQMPGIQQALPANGITAERFTRIVLTEVRKTPALGQCDPRSLLGAMMVSAQLGLEIGGHLGQAYLVPYKRECTLIIGYKGIIELARRSGTVKSIVARAVHENDEFDYGYGLAEYVTHKPALTNRGDAIAYYGVAQFKDGGHLIHVMSKDDIDARRERSKAGRNGPWVTDYDAMACKTVIRAMAPFLPLTGDDHRNIQLDETRGPSTLDVDLDTLALEAGDDHEDGVEDAVVVDPETGEPLTEAPANADGEPNQPTLDKQES